MPLPCGPSRGQAHGGTQPVFPASSGYPDAPGPLQGSEGGAGARVRPGERVRAPTKVPRLASSWATRPQSPLLSGQVTSASVGFCAQRLPPGPSESGSHRQVPSPLWESESLRGRTHEATARCPALTSVRFPQPLRSRPEGESGPGPRSPRGPEDRRPHPAAAAERRPSEPAQTCSPDCPRAAGGTAWHGGRGLAGAWLYPGVLGRPRGGLQLAFRTPPSPPTSETTGWAAAAHSPASTDLWGAGIRRPRERGPQAPAQCCPLSRAPASFPGQRPPPPTSRASTGIPESQALRLAPLPEPVELWAAVSGAPWWSLAKRHRGNKGERRVV